MGVCVHIFKWANSGLFSFIFISSTWHNHNYSYKILDGMLGTRTQGGRMEGADISTVLWPHPKMCIHILRLTSGLKFMVVSLLILVLPFVDTMNRRLFSHSRFVLELRRRIKGKKSILNLDFCQQSEKFWLARRKLVLTDFR